MKASGPSQNSRWEKQLTMQTTGNLQDLQLIFKSGATSALRDIAQHFYHKLKEYNNIRALETVNKEGVAQSQKER
jgi:hypothetical protein